MQVFELTIIYRNIPTKIVKMFQSLHSKACDIVTLHIIVGFQIINHKYHYMMFLDILTSTENNRYEHNICQIQLSSIHMTYVFLNRTVMKLLHFWHFDPIMCFIWCSLVFMHYHKVHECLSQIRMISLDSEMQNVSYICSKTVLDLTLPAMIKNKNMT